MAKSKRKKKEKPASGSNDSNRKVFSRDFGMVEKLDFSLEATNPSPGVWCYNFCSPWTAYYT